MWIWKVNDVSGMHGKMTWRLRLDDNLICMDTVESLSWISVSLNVETMNEILQQSSTV